MPRGSAPGERRGGREKGTKNKVDRSIKERASLHGVEMLNALVKMAKSAKSEAARVAAAKEVLDRAYGKAPQAITGEEGEGPVRHVLEVVWAAANASSARES